MLKEILDRLSVRSTIVVILLLGSVGIAVIDRNFRTSVADLAKVGIGGYLGQMLPEKE